MKLIIFFFITLGIKILGGKLHQCAKRLMKKFSPKILIPNVMKKKIISFISYHLIMLFLNNITRIF